MRLLRVGRRSMAGVLLAALLASCSNPSEDTATPDTSTAAATATPDGTVGPRVGPAVPSTTPPFATATPGVVTTVGDTQQVVISSVDRFFDPGVFHVHPGKVRVILRNDDQFDVHNLIFEDQKATTNDVRPGQVGDLTVILNKPGLYDFICSYHLLIGMRGQVKVE